MQILFSSLKPIKRPFMKPRPVSREDQRWWTYEVEVPRWEETGEYEVVGVTCHVCGELIDDRAPTPRRDGVDMCHSCTLLTLPELDFEGVEE